MHCIPHKEKPGKKAEDEERERASSTAFPTQPASPGATLVSEIHALRSALFGFRCLCDSFFDVRCQAVESLLYIDVAFCRDFEEGNAKFVSELLASLCRDGPLLLPVTFVANENLVHSLRSMLFDIREPCADV